MRIAVMGSGGVGGYFGAKLARAGSDVTFIARGAHLEAMQKSGLLVESKAGNIQIDSPQVTSDPASIGKVDMVLFGVKLWDTAAAAQAIVPLVGPQTAVVSFQNGVQKDELLRSAVGDNAVMGGGCYIAATIARSESMAARARRVRKPSSKRAGKPALTRRSARISGAQPGRSSFSSSACRRPRRRCAPRWGPCGPIREPAPCCSMP